MGFRNSFEQLDYRLLLPFYSRLPHRMALQMVRMHAALRRRMASEKARAIIRQARSRLPGCSDARALGIAKGVFETCAIDDLWTFWLGSPKVSRRFQVHRLAALEKTFQASRGLLLVTGHFGPPAAFLHWLGFEMKHPFCLVSEALDQVPNRSEAWRRFGRDRIRRLEEVASRPGVQVGSHAYISLRRCLRAGQTVVLATDVPPGGKSRSRVDFLSQPACFPNGAARLYLETGVPVVHFRVGNPRRGLYRIQLTNLSSELDGVVVLEEIVQIFTGKIEESVRVAADEWQMWEVVDSFFAR